jgi:hypothetical protein
MSIKTVQQAFEAFERDSVRVPERENQDAKRVQREFRQAIKEELGPLYADSFLAGSYRRKTQAVHLKDLDIIVVLNDPTGEFAASAKATLYAMKAVAKAYAAVAVTRVKCRAVECELDGHPYWLDFVPALGDGEDGLLLAYNSDDEGLDEWRSADPEAQTQACIDKNAQTDGIYILVTRVCKYWNQSFVSSSSQKKPMPSYLVEAILHDALSRPGEWAHAVLAFFERAQHHLQTPSPTVPCPGDPENYVDEKLEDDRRLLALAKVEVALADARAAVAESDPGKAMDAWVKVFGPAFPAPSTHPSRIAQALKTGAATVGGTGITPFPSGRRPIPARSHGPARRQC